MIKALFFDVGGTIFDWKNTAREQIQALAQAHGQPIDGEAFAYAWREAMFEIHTQVRHGNLPWLNSDEMHLRALENMAGMRTAYVNVPEKDSVTAGFGDSGDEKFDIEAEDYETLCQRLQV
ncbi:MAG: hypothetical protein CL608_05625 [Anaerolineaceae bacterium]|nr:hypothetical protein [Anaerolineaceae bacterium]